MGILVRDKGCRGGAGKSCKCHILKSLGLCFKRMDGTGFLSSGEARLDFYSMWRADWRSCSPPHKTGWWFSLGNDARGGKWRDWRLSL